MSTAENTTGLAEVLAAHSDWYGHGLHTYTCECGTPLSTKPPTTEEAHRAHVADMLTQVIEAREAELRAEIARQIRDQIPPHGLKCCDGIDIAARIAEGGDR